MSHSCAGVKEREKVANPCRQVIAVAGKGGVGKTTISAILSRILTKRGQKVLAVDADPPVSLTYALGAAPEKTVGEIRRKFIEDPGEKRRIKDKHIRDVIVDEALMVLEELDLLVVGQGEGPGCHCGLNELLKYGIESLSSDYEITVIDCEAGLEQINRRVISSVTDLIMVSDATQKGIRTAAYLKDIAGQHGVEGEFRTGLIINRAAGGTEDLQEQAESLGLPLLGMIPSDDLVAQYDLAGRPTFDLPAEAPSVKAVNEVIKALDNPG